MPPKEDHNPLEPLPPKTREWLRTLDEENIRSLDWLLRQSPEDLQFYAWLARLSNGAGAFGKLIGYLVAVPSAAYGLWSFIGVAIDYLSRKSGVK